MAATPTTPNGMMTGAEVQFCKDISAVANEVLHGRLGFSEFSQRLATDLRAFVAADFDADRLYTSSKMLHIQSTAQDEVAALAPVERSFILDLVGLLDYAVRNGVTLSRVAAMISHDLAEIRHFGNIKEALEIGLVRPMVSGWAERNSTPVGEADANEQE